MTGKIVNLRQRRKAKARDDDRRQADGNAAKHGRTKAERLRETSEAERAITHLDGHRRDKPDA